MSFSLPSYHVVTGRGATAIYLALSHITSKLGEPGVMLAPANVCYAALYPALYAGWSIRLIDASPVDGNLTVAGVREALTSFRCHALLAPHMYGQPIAELPLIARDCARAGVTLIEDCASAMGATASYPVGHVGDYAIFSTGYAKVVDLGYGGLLASERHGLDWARPEIATLPPHSEELEQTETLFGKVYRTLRSFPDNRLDQAIYHVMPEATRDLFLHRLDIEQEAHLIGALSRLEGIVLQRRSWQDACEELWRQAAPAHARTYPYSVGAVPWRFTFFVDPKIRKPLVSACLDEGVPISDWYPSIAPMLGDLGSYPGVEEMGDSILNLPLSDETVKEHLPCVLELLARLQRGL